MISRDITNRLELRVVGMSRSGNHAILHWILEQAIGRVCFLNCVEPKSNPYLTARPMHGDRRAWASYDEFRLRREAAGKLSQKDLLIYNYEDCFLSTVCHHSFEAKHDEYVGQSQRRLDLLILRDPFNLFASRMRSNYSGVTMQTSIRIWTQHARQFLGERNFVTQPFVPVNFNRWARDRDYRSGLAETLGLTFTDAGFTKVPAVGGGSSFDKRRFDGEANKMNIVGRWRHASQNEHYRQLFNADVLRLSHAIFGRVQSDRKFAEFVQSLETQA